MEDFTVKKAILIQQDQLKSWKKVLTPEAFEDLRTYAEQNNATADNPNKIIRGSDLSVFVTNYSNQIKPVDKDAPMTKMTADDLRSLRFGDKVYYGNGVGIRSLNYVGRMPTAEKRYLIFSDGEYLTYLYIGSDNTFRGDWFMGKYDSKFFGNYMKDYHLKQIENIETVYLKEKDSE